MLGALPCYLASKIVGSDCQAGTIKLPHVPRPRLKARGGE